MIVGESAPGEALVTCERPEQVITEQSASRPDQVRAALRSHPQHLALLIERDQQQIFVPINLG